MGTYGFDGEYITADSIQIDEPLKPYNLVNDRFTQTLAKAQEVLELLMGSDGTGGLIGEMADSLSAPPPAAITVEAVDTSLTLETSGLPTPVFDGVTVEAPVFEGGNIEAPTFEGGGMPVPSFPGVSADVPSLPGGMVTVPSIDVDFSGINAPADISVGMSWAEANLPAEVYNALKTQILLDLAEGSTGINGAVEEAIYTRARNRQQVENLSAYNRINNTIAQLQHSLPSGVSAAILADFGIGQMRQEADLENSIIETQAKLAQENRKNAFSAAVQLDQLIRLTRNEESSRALESAKTLADVAIKKYTADIQAFQALWEGKKAEVQARAESVRAAVDTNKGLVDMFRAEVEAFAAVSNVETDVFKTEVAAFTAVSNVEAEVFKVEGDVFSTISKVETDVFKAEVDAFSAVSGIDVEAFKAEVEAFGVAERSSGIRNESAVKLIEEKIAAADLDLRGQVAEANALVQSYTAEMSINERVSSDRMQVASHVAAALLSAVNASASVGYSGSESASTDYRVSVSGSESHSVEHDPAA